MLEDLQARCRELLLELGIIETTDTIEAVALSGGVASDIAMVAAGDREVCVKFALPKLKVEADWSAPVHRNAAEYAWLEFAAKVAPENAVVLHGRSETLHGFAMEYVSGNRAYLWKARLLAEDPTNGEAAKVGRLLGQIHAASAEQEFDRHAFANRDDFRALRIEPYLLSTARQHPDLAQPLQQLADQLYSADQVLVHGDVSPKNILFRGDEPILLDAECATLGDASFDPAFCLNHLVLKAIHLPGSRLAYLEQANEFWKAYSRWISWEQEADTETRVCKLLPALMLARVDGKSPVEYLSIDEQASVRRIARHFIRAPLTRLIDLLVAVGHRAMEADT